MLNLDPAKLLVILVVALIVLGPERLPKVARQLAGLVKEFNRVRDELQDHVREAIPEVGLPSRPGVPPLSSMLAPRRAAAADPEAAGLADEPAVTRRPPALVVHPTLGEVAFVPDDPSMN